MRSELLWCTLHGLSAHNLQYFAAVFYLTGSVLVAALLPSQLQAYRFSITSARQLEFPGVQTQLEIPHRDGDLIDELNPAHVFRDGGDRQRAVDDRSAVESDIEAFIRRLEDQYRLHEDPRRHDVGRDPGGIDPNSEVAFDPLAVTRLADEVYWNRVLDLYRDRESSRVPGAIGGHRFEAETSIGDRRGIEGRADPIALVIIDGDGVPGGEKLHVVEIGVDDTRVDGNDPRNDFVVDGARDR